MCNGLGDVVGCPQFNDTRANFLAHSKMLQGACVCSCGTKTRILSAIVSLPCCKGPRMYPGRSSLPCICSPKWRPSCWLSSLPKHLPQDPGKHYWTRPVFVACSSSPVRFTVKTEVRPCELQARKYTSSLVNYEAHLAVCTTADMQTTNSRLMGPKMSNAQASSNC